MNLRRPGQGASEKAKSIRRAVPAAKAEERAWRIGGEGEERLGKWLDGLPKRDWLVLHDLTLSAGGANLDHLVVGPPGVFTVNTKNHPGKKVWVASRVLMVNGHKTDYLPRAVREGERVQKGIARHTDVAFTVRPVLAILCLQMTVKDRPADVHVVEGRFFRPWLQGRPVVHRGSDLWNLLHDVAIWAKELEDRFGEGPAGVSSDNG